MVAPTPIQGQERIIEKRGLLKLSAEEKASHLVDIWCSVLQLPYQHSVNYLYPREKSLYGRYNTLSQGYVVGTDLIYYPNTRLFRINRQLEATTEGLGCYLDAVFKFFVILAPLVNPSFVYSYSREPIHVYPPEFDAIAFSLPDGCVLKVTTTGYRLQGCNEPVTELLDPPDSPPIGDPPSDPPTEGVPPTTGRPDSGAVIEISPPYDRNTNDNGDTYVPPGEWVDEYATVPDGTAWIVRAELDWRRNSDDSPVTPSPGKYEAEATIYGRYVRLGYLSGAEYSGTGAYVEFERSPGAALEKAGIGGSTSALDIYPRLRLVNIRRA